MTLSEVPSLIGCPDRPLAAVSITRVTEDSRRCIPGAIFVAASGTKVDGHDFAPYAAAAGAVAIIGERTGFNSSAGLPYLSVTNARAALGILAHALHGDPSRQMIVIGVTGTNGKTTTTKMVQQILRAHGDACACFGTIGYEIGGTLYEAAHTTPFGEDLADMFARARDAGESHVVMEVSSHALAQERVAGIHFHCAAFTNLTQDHLDYHKDMDAYRRAKLMLFERIEGDEGFTVVNAEDPSAQAFRDASRVTCHTFGKGGKVRAVNSSIGARMTTFTLHTPWGNTNVTMRMLGKHNVSNALCAAAICGGLGVPVETIAAALGSLQSVPGRFEHVDVGQEFQVIVDYAHTDDGLRNVLTAAQEICSGRVIVVFGCGGDRDKGKRPKMGRVAAELGDFAIVTSDNPRSEDPERILLDIEVGLQHAGKQKYDDYLMILDRAEAIRTAIDTAKPGDLVLIAGKGHEDYQILGATRIHFDDREVARDILLERV
ncbi:MAG TPA: UDP-N-acetylmuramoyl-L-alanyl-D-glutamate--2,6-diaminopimelate ligase [Candidatus Hydrogenedentes bacterium]|nr:UDP-N-acetylmuramoyl-L-alanyl-D-glutamate--2,6-diaminopimelate ligase [Candidatus Hydrogenedentota bacterium]HRK35120.1 UDP-N-acetylmuramoyl-L-alanyl-D-glutamate--2,6-diaminopimelate ligase [Candidatus Hydrogenedentota bacterium]